MTYRASWSNVTLGPALDIDVRRIAARNLSGAGDVEDARGHVHVVADEVGALHERLVVVHLDSHQKAAPWRTRPRNLDRRRSVVSYVSSASGNDSSRPLLSSSTTRGSKGKTSFTRSLGAQQREAPAAAFERAAKLGEPDDVVKIIVARYPGCGRGRRASGGAPSTCGDRRAATLPLTVVPRPVRRRPAHSRRPGPRPPSRTSGFMPLAG